MSHKHKKKKKERKIIIAIDGHSSCGKSTVAKAIAKELGYTFIDTGAMYRCVTLFYLRNAHTPETLVEDLDLINIEFKFNPELGFSEAYLNGENVEQEIRKMEVSQNVSLVSTIKEVREKLVKLQQKMGEAKGVCMDGRDIGTAVFPNADLKLFVTADVDVRAQRRFKELTDKGEEITFEDVKFNLTERDRIDSTRKESPLSKAKDAIVVDTTFMKPKGQLLYVSELVKHKLKELANQKT
jgi:cytidylate kinase